MLITSNILIYGANGYSAKLIIQEVLKIGLKPILAGRNTQYITSLANKHNLDYRIFSLSNQYEISKGLEDIEVVLNCAGPFIKTIKPLLEACLEKKAHYLDITGEINAFEIAHSYNEQAKQQGIIICPGVGFDVVPTDCLALMLNEQFNYETSNLELAFHSQGGPSKGTALTSLSGTGSGTKVRREGKLVTVPYGKFQKDVKFPNKTLRVNAIPWGDVFTSYISTGIPNVTVYMAMHPKTIKKIQRFQKFFFIRKIQPFKWYITRKIKKSIPQGSGPTEEIRNKTQSFIWGHISDSNGNSLELNLKTPNVYTLTSLTASSVVNKVSQIRDKNGYFTPSLLFGSHFILDIPGVELINS